MSFRESSPPASEQRTREEVLHDRLMKELGWVLNEVESCFSSKTEMAHIQSQPITKARLERAHAWLDRAAEGAAVIPDRMSEDYVTELCDEFGHIYKRFTDLHAGILPAPEQTLVTPDELRVANRITNILRELEKKGADPKLVARALAGLDTEDSIKFRQELAADQGTIPSVVESLYETSSEDSIKIRRWLIDNKADLDAVVKTLRDVSTPASMDFRYELLSRGADASAVLTSLNRVGTSQSLLLRAELLKKGVTLGDTFFTLMEIDNPESMEFRESLPLDCLHEFALLDSLRGVHGARSMKIRRVFADDGMVMDAVARSLNGIDTPQSHRLRRRLLALGADSREVLDGLDNALSQESMILRRDLLREASIDPTSVLSTLRDVATPESIKLRTELLVKHQESEDVRKALGYSLQGINTPEADSLRQQFLDSTGDYPNVARSLRNVHTSASMRLRRVLINLGAQVPSVMRTLQGIATHESMECRRVIAKSNRESALHGVALSLVGVYTDEAFTMRDELFKDDPDFYSNSLFDNETSNYASLLRHGITYAAAEGVK